MMKYTAAIVSMMAVLLVGCDQGYRDERRAQHINCVSNLKMIGIAFRLWEGDHGDQFPFNLSTNAGGTMELCATNMDGFDRNAYLHLRTMTNELTAPLLLICPQDRSKKAATNWANLQAENITYRFRSGPNVTETNENEVLAICPIDGNTLYCDGHVAEGKQAGGKKSDDHNLMHVQ
jgi:prepilin-type processing-associated H-X9-DG protein